MEDTLTTGGGGDTLPSSAQAWEAARLGSIDELQLVDSPVAPIAQGELLVAVRAIGLNFADVFCCLGLYEAANAVLKETGGSFCPGLEFAGEVLAVGSAVSGFSRGDRVFGFSRFGAYRSVVVSSSAYVRPVPHGWSYEQAASLLVQGLTAWYGLVPLGAVRRGSRVLIHSAAGGVGCAAMLICTSLGCEIVGVVGSEEKADFLRTRFPTSRVIVRGSERGYKAQLEALPGGGRFDCVLDSLGGGYFSTGLDALDPMGRIVHFGQTYSYGGASGGLRKWLTLIPGYLSRPKLDPGQLVGTNRSVMGFNLIWLTERVDLLTSHLEEMLEKGGLLLTPPVVGKTFPFECLPQALHYLNSGNSVGKVVVTLHSA